MIEIGYLSRVSGLPIFQKFIRERIPNFLLILFTEDLKRGAEILIGAVLCLLGFIMLFTPGPGVPLLISGIMFVSPQHGQRAVWFFIQSWKKIKTIWHGVFYDRFPKWSKFKKCQQTGREKPWW